MLSDTRSIDRSFPNWIIDMGFFVHDDDRIPGTWSATHLYPVIFPAEHLTRWLAEASKACPGLTAVDPDNRRVFSTENPSLPCSSPQGLVGIREAGTWAVVGSPSWFPVEVADCDVKSSDRAKPDASPQTVEFASQAQARCGLWEDGWVHLELCSVARNPSRGS